MADIEDDDPGDYAVGYGKPPKHTRFQKGQSGNPKGRKSRTKNFAALLRLELDRLIGVRDGDGTKTISKLEALITTLVHDAIRGKPSAQRILMAFINASPVPEAFVPDAGDEAALKRFKAQLQKYGSKEEPDDEDAA